MARKRKYHHSRSGGFSTKGTFWKTALGVGAYSLVWEPFVTPIISPYTGGSTTESVVELAIGAWFMRSKGIVGDVAKAMVVINSYKLMNNVVRPMIIGR